MKANMVSLRCNRRLNKIFCNRSCCTLFLGFVFLLCFLKFAIQHEPGEVDFQNVFLTSNGFLAATRTNRDQNGSSVCVVDPAITGCDNQGFAAFLLYTLDHIMMCRALGSGKPVVFWRACYSVCSKDSRVNSWEWYFKPINRGLESQVERVLCPLLVYEVGDIYKYLIWNNSFKKRPDVPGFDGSLIIDTEERLRINSLIQQYAKPTDRITRKVRTFYNRYLAGYTVLGVHVRGTDHWVETSEQRLPPLTSWINSAKTILETLPQPRKIFIASDNYEAIDKFVTFFGKEAVAYTTAVRAERYHGNVPPHYFEFEQNASDPYERVVGTQVFLDVLLLAKCDHFLHAESSVASLASYFNPHMKSYFMEPGKYDKRENKKRRFQGRKINEIKDEMEQGDPNNDKLTTLKCFEKNAATSPCPDAAKGKFINFEEARSFLTHL